MCPDDLQSIQGTAIVDSVLLKFRQTSLLLILSSSKRNFYANNYYSYQGNDLRGMRQ